MSDKKPLKGAVLDFESALKDKRLDEKEEKLANMAKRFEAALPTKATPVKDYLKKKRKNKKKR